MVSRDESSGSGGAAAAAAATATVGAGANGKKKFLGLGSYLPKVPTYLLQKNGATAGAGGPSAAANANANAGNAEDPADEIRELPDFPDRRSNDSDSTSAQQQQPQSAAAAAAAALRRRGMSIEMNVSTLYRKMTVRQSSNSTASTDGSPSNRGSLTGAGSNYGGATNVPSPRSDPSLKARRGACVATKFGTGVVVDIRLDDGFYIVQLVPKSVAYLREDMIIREIKSVVGERVKTRWGLATVEHYYVEDDMYSIALDWRWDDDHVWRMKATTKKFEKILVRGSIMQNTKNMLFEGYSTIRGSTTTGYANVVARLNTTATTVSGASKRQGNRSLGKAITPFGICEVLDVRSDKFFVVKTPCGATGYFHADDVKLLQRRTHFAPGDRVKTPYGLGEVHCYRDEDETYEIKLELALASTSLAPTLYISDAHAETQLAFAGIGHNNPTRENRLSSIFALTRNSVFSAGATVKASATGGFSTLSTGGLTTLSTVKAKVSTMATIKLSKAKFQKGERVLTKMGSGFVVEARPLEKIYEVYLRRLKFTGYFHESALSPFPYERVTHFVVDGRTIPAPEIPRNVSDVKRRQVINAAIQSAREGKFLEVPAGVTTASAEAPPASEAESSEVVPAPVAPAGAL